MKIYKLLLQSIVVSLAFMSLIYISFVLVQNSFNPADWGFIESYNYSNNEGIRNYTHQAYISLNIVAVVVGIAVGIATNFNGEK